jgi:hypothetical protein
MDVYTKREVCELISRLFDAIEAKKDEMSTEDVLSLIGDVGMAILDDMKETDYHDPLAIIVISDDYIKSKITPDADKYFGKRQIDIFSHDVHVVCEEAQKRLTVDMLRKSGNVETYFYKKGDSNGK